ncbi:exopolysaccharide biosynthesis protein [Emcibacter sp.]|uniref:exopolysaccharide biosynthesis protein n=1 Tax=Emcibacter sp. TaxID=1979954 RepID=UPI002AA7C6EA|nr:exopolysaccharide biosynthesis protein [Emcibacter sp.]
MSSHYPPPRPLSVVLTELMDGLQGEMVSLQQVSDQMGTRAYGAFMVLLTLPNFIPGLSLVSGALMAIFSMQMVLGIEHPWLPAFIGRFTIPKANLVKAMAVILPRLQLFEHRIRPRWIIMNTQVAIRIMGLVVVFLSLIVILPIPLSNFIPSVALLFMAFGMMQKDGLVVLISALIGVLYSVLYLWLVWDLVARFLA